MSPSSAVEFKDKLERGRYLLDSSGVNQLLQLLGARSAICDNMLRLELSVDKAEQLTDMYNYYNETIKKLLAL